MDGLIERIAALELEVERARRVARRTRMVAIGLFAAIGFCFVAGSRAPTPIGDDLKVRSLQIVDANGKPRIDLRVLEAGPAPGAVLSLLNEKGHSVCSMQEDKEGTNIFFSDDAGRVRCAMGLDKRGASLAFADENQRTRLKLAAGDDSSDLVLTDADRVVRGSFRADKSATSLSLYDEKQVVRCQLSHRKAGPGMILRDEADKPRCLIGVTEIGPGIMLYDADRKAIASMP